MKKLIIVTSLAIVHLLDIHAGNVQEIFLKANAAYIAGNINDALKQYQSIEPKGHAVLYNMGNCYYRLGDYPQAVLQWRRAQKDASLRDWATLEAYITSAYEALGTSSKKSIIDTIHTWMSRINSIFSIMLLQILFLVCWLVLCVLLPRLIRTTGYVSLVLLSIMTLLMGLCLFVKYRDQKYPLGLVSKNSISVYAGPGQDYALVTQATMLELVRVYQRHDGWLKVIIDKTGYGWIQEADLAMI